MDLVIHYRLTESKEKFWITLHMKNEQGEKIFSFSASEDEVQRTKKTGEYKQIYHIPANFLNWGNYAIDFMSFEFLSSVIPLVIESDMISFTLAGKSVEVGGWMGREPGDVTPKFICEETRL